MKYIASVKYEGKQELITKDYPTKKEFKEDLLNNGYSVRFITTEENFDIDCDKFHEKLETQRIKNKIRYDYDKKDAKKYGVSVPVYRQALKRYFECDSINSTLSLKDLCEIYNN